MQNDMTQTAQLARIFIDHSLKVQKGDSVVICASDFTELELLQETYAYALQKGAFVYLDIAGFNLMLDRVSYGDFAKLFYDYASEEQLKNIPDPQKTLVEWGNKFVRITSLDNPKHLTNVDAAKIQVKQSAYRDLFDQMIEKEWVLTYVPNTGMAQAAGMSLSELRDFYYKSVIIDYEKMRKELEKLEKAIDEGKEIHLIGEKTDLVLNIEGRTGHPCYGTRNIPDGEVFTAPVENAVNGHVYFDFPGLYSGKIIEGIYLEFKDGKVVKYTSRTNQDALEKILNTDEGAKTLGEFAIGANYGIQNYMYNTLFDEKIGGTIHMALGKAYTDPKGWGINKSAIHWDIVKDMRLPGSKLTIDGKDILVEGKIVV